MLGLAVLHLTVEVAKNVEHLSRVFLHKLSVLLQSVLGTFAHVADIPLLGLVLLISKVERAARHYGLVLGRAILVADFAAAVGTRHIAVNKVGVRLDEFRIIGNRPSELPHLFAQFGAVVTRQGIVRLFFQDKGKVLNGTVIVADERAQQTAIVVRHEMFGHQLERFVVIGQSLVETVLRLPRLGTRHVIFVVVGTQFDGACEERVGGGIVLVLQGIIALETPSRLLAGLLHKERVHPRQRTERVFLFETDLRLDEIGTRKAGPAVKNVGEVAVGAGIVFELQAAEGAVVDAALVVGHL